MRTLHNRRRAKSNGCVRREQDERRATPIGLSARSSYLLEIYFAENASLDDRHLGTNKKKTQYFARKRAMFPNGQKKPVRETIFERANGASIKFN